MTNQAKKIESTGIVPTVGMILMPKGHKPGNHKPCRIIVVGRDIDGLKVCRAGGTNSMGFGTMNKKYRVATSEEAAAFDAAVPARDVDFVEPALSTEPSVPRATVAHEPPQPPPANDTTAAPLVKTDIDAAIERVESRMLSQFALLLQKQQEMSDARMERILDKFEQRRAVDAPSAPVAVAPSKKSKDEQDAINKEIIRRESPWAEPLIHRFIDAELEVVQFDSPKNIERAMLPGEFHDALFVWCRQVGEQAPDQRTTFSLIDDRISPSRHTVKGSHGKKRKTMFARRRQMDLDLTGDGEFIRVMNDARNLWPSFKDDSTVALRIKAMLAGHGRKHSATVEEMIDAVRGAALEAKHKRVSVFPEDVFGNPGTIRVYAKIARDFGGGK